VSVLVRSYESILRPPGTRFIPLDGLAIDLIMLWRHDSEPPALPAFRAAIEHAALCLLPLLRAG
jgi:hypothetical protein